MSAWLLNVHVVSVKVVLLVRPNSSPTHNHLSFDHCFHHQNYFENAHSILQELCGRHTSEFRWKLESQMSDATVAYVVLNHDKNVFGLLYNSHPLVWQMCMVSVHSLVLRPGASVRNGAFFVLS